MEREKLIAWEQRVNQDIEETIAESQSSGISFESAIDALEAERSYVQRLICKLDN